MKTNVSIRKVIFYCQRERKAWKVAFTLKPGECWQVEVSQKGMRCHFELISHYECPSVEHCERLVEIAAAKNDRYIRDGTPHSQPLSMVNP